MSDKDDPFGLSSDAGRTRIRPVRGGGGGTAAPATPTARGLTEGGRPAYGAASGPSVGVGRAPRIRRARAHPNPLVTAFAPLLELAPELESAAPPAQAETLRLRLYENLVDARD